MTSRFDRIESLFHEALARPASERASWIEAQCQGDIATLQEVLSLLNAHAAMASATTAPAPAEPDSPLPTAHFGPYRAIRLLGRGGMSAVYQAERNDGQFDQTVALKIMAGYLSGPEFLRRFETERQFLATLNHPNITHLLDGGISSAGDPFLITEYVDGLPLDRYCDERKLDIKSRLRIFLQVCDAVDYAHRNLIVHRDLKPANILVNGEGAVKLLDFGTASFLDDRSAVTATRARMLTPRYASPEQLRGERVNTATDVFSLGVVLYELLSGTWPFGDPLSVISELNRATGRVSANPPSTVITPEAAANRSVPDEHLRRTLKGDLSAIVLKALENSPARRYESVKQFAGDVAAYLEGRPVTARAQTLLYRSGKFLRRRWLPAAAAAIFILGLTGATLTALRQARVAQLRYADLRSLTTTLLFELKDAITDVPGSTPAQKILVTRVVKSLDSMGRQSGRDSKLSLDLAEAYRQLGELQASPYVQNLGDSAGSLANLAKARSLAAQQLSQAPRDVAPLHAAALIEETFGEVYFGMGQSADSITHLTASAAYAEQLVQASGTIPDLMEAAIVHQVLGDVYGQPGTASLSDPERASAQYRRSSALDQMMVQKDPSMARPRRGIAINHQKLGDLVLFTDPETALGEYQTALTTFDSLPPGELKRLQNLRYRAQLLRKLGGAFRDLQQFSESEPYLKQSLAFFEEDLAADPEDKRAKYDVVVISEAFLELYGAQGKFAAARAQAERMVALMDDLVRGDPDNSTWHVARGYYRYRLANDLWKLGERDRAAAIGAKGLAESAREADSPKTTPQALQLASEAWARILPATLRDRSRALKYAERYGKLRPTQDVSALYRLAIAQSSSGPSPEAVETARRALALMPAPRNGRINHIRTELEAIR
jgi:serine/threonine protein kinase